MGFLQGLSGLLPGLLQGAVGLLPGGSILSKLVPGALNVVKNIAGGKGVGESLLEAVPEALGVASEAAEHLPGVLPEKYKGLGSMLQQGLKGAKMMAAHLPGDHTTSSAERSTNTSNWEKEGAKYGDKGEYKKEWDYAKQNYKRLFDDADDFYNWFESGVDQDEPGSQSNIDHIDKDAVMRINEIKTGDQNHSNTGLKHSIDWYKLTPAELHASVLDKTIAQFIPIEYGGTNPKNAKKHVDDNVAEVQTLDSQMQPIVPSSLHHPENAGLPTSTIQTGINTKNYDRTSHAANVAPPHSFNVWQQQKFGQEAGREQRKAELVTPSQTGSVYDTSRAQVAPEVVVKKDMVAMSPEEELKHLRGKVAKHKAKKQAKRNPIIKRKK